MSLALSTLVYEWRRYLAAVIALAFSGMMVLAFSGLFAGIIHSEFATWERSPADLFILPPNVASLVNNNASLPARVLPTIYLNPNVVDVEALSGTGGLWVNAPKPGQKQVQKYVQFFGVNPTPNSVTLPRDYPDQVRVALMEPGAVAVDVSALPQLGVKLGDQASVNGKTVWIRALLHNYQNADNVDVVASDDTLRMLGLRGDGTTVERTGPLMVRVRDPRQAPMVRDQLNAIAHGTYRAWTRAEFNAANENAVMSEQIIGVLLVFAVFLAGLIGVGVTSQTLRGAILSNIREFASLRALGISMGSLRLIVMELSFWVGVAGLLASLGMTALVSLLAGAVGLPIVMRIPTMAFVCVMLMVIAVISGAMAMGILKKSQPADLLR
jgi:putative ABC transport system permease protein